MSFVYSFLFYVSPQKESFQMYECYCQNKPRSEALWRQFSDCSFFQVSFPPFSSLSECFCMIHLLLLSRYVYSDFSILQNSRDVCLFLLSDPQFLQSVYHCCFKSPLYVWVSVYVCEHRNWMHVLVVPSGGSVCHQSLSVCVKGLLWRGNVE